MITPSAKQYTSTPRIHDVPPPSSRASSRPRWRSRKRSGELASGAAAVSPPGWRSEPPSRHPHYFTHLDRRSPRHRGLPPCDCRRAPSRGRSSERGLRAQDEHARIPVIKTSAADVLYGLPDPARACCRRQNGPRVSCFEAHLVGDSRAFGSHGFMLEPWRATSTQQDVLHMLDLVARLQLDGLPTPPDRGQEAEAPRSADLPEARLRRLRAADRLARLEPPACRRTPARAPFPDRSIEQQGLHKPVSSRCLRYAAARHVEVIPG